jgi:hypothetical protein
MQASQESGKTEHVQGNFCLVKWESEAERESGGMDEERGCDEERRTKNE